MPTEPVFCCFSTRLRIGGNDAVAGLTTSENMRDYLVFYINGKEERVGGSDVFMPLSSYLRYVKQKTGTKVVCEEGDCGACTVLLGRVKDGEISYQPVNSCIQFLYQLDCSHIVTVEGLKIDGQLNAVQQSMVDCHGAQCGYCTPGFIVAMQAIFDQSCDGPKTCGDSVSEKCVKDALTGNLCRCTGYESIIKAGMEVVASEMVSLHKLYPTASMIETFAKQSKTPILIESEGKKFFNPVDVASAVEFKNKNAGTVIVSGGTDVCVTCNKRGYDPQSVMSLSNIEGMQEIRVVDDVLHVGGKVTLTQLEDYVKDLIPELHKMLWVFGSPQIKNAGTLAGNIANASPIADTLPFLFVMNAEIVLSGLKGTRSININKLYKGYKQLDMTADELIGEIRIPLPKQDDILKLYKVSKRKNLDISSFTAAMLMRKSGSQIESINIAYGGVAAVVLRLLKTEEFLKGKSFTEDTFAAAGQIARGEITPISDVRGSSDFRYQLAENVLMKFFHECGHDRELVCR